MFVCFDIYVFAVNETERVVPILLYFDVCVLCVYVITLKSILKVFNDV